MPEDSAADISYGEKLRRKGIQVRTSGWSWRTRDQVAEGRTDEGGRFKTVRDQAGHEVTEETTPTGRQRRHVHINL
jgi:hypothetical protein